MNPPAVPLPPKIIVVMGVSGAGKTTIGRRIAERLGLPFLEGDAFHPPANVAKMSSGHPLDDGDRRPWLEAMARELDRARRAGSGVVLGASALRRSYRDILRDGHDDVVFVFLSGDKDLIRRRIEQRRGHFMPPELLDSQFSTLEPPAEDERTVTVDVAGAPEETLAAALRGLAPGSAALPGRA